MCFLLLCLGVSGDISLDSTLHVSPRCNKPGPNDHVVTCKDLPHRRIPLSGDHLRSYTVLLFSYSSSSLSPRWLTEVWDVPNRSAFDLFRDLIPNQSGTHSWAIACIKRLWTIPVQIVSFHIDYGRESWHISLSASLLGGSADHPVVSLASNSDGSAVGMGHQWISFLGLTSPRDVPY